MELISFALRVINKMLVTTGAYPLDGLRRYMFHLKLLKRPGVTLKYALKDAFTPQVSDIIRFGLPSSCHGLYRGFDHYDLWPRTVECS